MIAKTANGVPIKRHPGAITYKRWLHHCGWCGVKAPVATNGRDLFCSVCGHW
jgi:hypothetical protein